MLLRSALRTARAAHAESDICLSIADARTVKVGAWLTPDEQEAFARKAREVGYRSVSDCMRDLVLMTTSGGVLGVMDLQRQRLDALVRNRPSEATTQQ